MNGSFPSHIYLTFYFYTYEILKGDRRASITSVEEVLLERLVLREAQSGTT